MLWPESVRDKHAHDEVLKQLSIFKSSYNIYDIYYKEEKILLENNNFHSHNNSHNLNITSLSFPYQYMFELFSV